MKLWKIVLVAALLLSANSFAGDVSIGTINKNGMEVSAVYIQPVTMEPMLPGMMDIMDIHLEADIHADKSNVHGFKAGDWVPYLAISYSISKKGSDWHTTGHLMPMVAVDGPHYAANIKLDGPGKYHLTYKINPPPFSNFYHHTDKETGVPSWWKPFQVEWDFAFVGTGKKGGY